MKNLGGMKSRNIFFLSFVEEKVEKKRGNLTFINTKIFLFILFLNSFSSFLPPQGRLTER